MFESRPWFQRKILQWLFGNPEILVQYDYEPFCLDTGPRPEDCSIKYAKEDDVGLDIFNYSSEPIVLKVGESVNIPAGIKLKIPKGYVGLIRGRSSTFYKRGLFVVHNTIDAGFVGSLFITVYYPGLNGKLHSEIIQPWERLGQIVIVPYLFAKICRVFEMPITSRGCSALGSTGL